MTEIGDFLDCNNLSRETISGENKLFDDIGHIKHTILPQSELSKKRNHLKSQYGLTLAQYDEMFERQNGKCAICGGINQNGSRLSVDHDHITGKIRGLLCNKCNLGLGVFEDSPEILKKAIKYLEK